MEMRLLSAGARATVCTREEVYKYDKAPGARTEIRAVPEGTS